VAASCAVRVASGGNKIILIDRILSLPYKAYPTAIKNHGNSQTLSIGRAASGADRHFAAPADSSRESISLDAGWRFTKGNSPDVESNQLSYSAIKAWILPTGNPFTTNAPAVRPDAEPAANISFAPPECV
jgi:hypothetical protein